MSEQPTALCLFGPTASGKTGLAIGLAQALNGVIINADSRQIYREMPVLTAVPSAEEYAAAPHMLYEVLPPDAPFSVGDYLKLARETAADVVAQGKMPLFVGGTGLYLEVLMRGISPVPEIPAEHLEALKTELAEKGRDALVAELRAVDPAWAGRIPPGDTQRLLRGLSVYRETGTPLSVWQARPRQGALPYKFTPLAIHRPRAEQLARIEARFDLMMAAGLLAEVQQVVAKGYSLELPALKSLGVREFAAHLAGELSFEKARERYLIQQNQYAKRQATWLKNTYPARYIYAESAVEKVLRDIANG